MGRLRTLLGLMMLGSSLWLLSLLGNHVGPLLDADPMALMLVALLLAVVWRHGMRIADPGAGAGLPAGRGPAARRRLHPGRKAPTGPVDWQRSRSKPSRMRWPRTSGFVDVTADWCITCKGQQIQRTAAR